MSKKEEILRVCSVGIRAKLGKAPIEYDALQEIRLRANRPLIVLQGDEEFFVRQDGQLTKDENQGISVPVKEIRETLEYVSNYSLYAYEEEIRQGFLTIQGGHRIGVAGKIVLEQGRIRTMKNISFLNIRVAHEKKDCAKWLFPWLCDHDGTFCHTLLFSPPGCGKTTLLRDLIRMISNGVPPAIPGLSVGVVDERSEIGACYLGVPQNDLGSRTDVLDGCPKREGILLLLRSMSPQVLAVDELGGTEDMETVFLAANSGCRVLATAHGGSMDEITKKWGEKGYLFFKRFVRLSRLQGAGTIEEIQDEHKNCLYRREH